MAAPAYATDLTTFWLEGATTVTALGGGGSALNNPETDFFIQGAGCISKGAWTNNTKGFIIDGLGATFTVPTDGAVVAFAKYDAQGSLGTQAAGGFRIIIGSANNAYDEFYVGGSDTMQYDSWIPYAVDPNTATPDVSNSGGAERWVGVLAYLPTSSGPTKGAPIGMDAIRYGRCEIRYTIGDITTPATFAGAELAGNVNSSRWGLLEFQRGAYQTQGFHTIGLAGTACYFDASDQVLFWRKQLNNITDDAVSANFNRVEILNASTTCNWTNIIWTALGTRARGQFVHTAGTCALSDCQFFDWDTFDFLSTAVIDNTSFSRCNAITTPGTSMVGSKVLLSTVAADTGAMIYNSATDTDGLLDDMIFSKGANAHHAIDFGLSVTGDIVLRGIEFTDFGSTDDSNDSTVRFLATSGSLNLSLIDCTVDGAAASAANFSVDDAAGITVSVIVAPVTIKITTIDTAGDPVTSAAILLAAADGTGPFPYQESITIARSGSVATVTHTGHGMASNDKVIISGSELTEPEYIGVKQITFIDVNSYSYTVAGTPTTPATGTIISTFVAIQGTSDGVTGILTTTRVYSSDQPVVGWTRKMSSAPYYKEGILTGDISSTTGYVVSTVMPLDQ